MRKGTRKTGAFGGESPPVVSGPLQSQSNPVKALGSRISCPDPMLSESPTPQRTSS